MALVGRLDEHKQVEALLSPYLDGRTSAAERALVEQHIGTCGDCARSLATLRATVMAVREMPHVRAPRSFALPRSMVRPARAVAWPYPLLRAATGVAAFLFVLVLGMDLFTHKMQVPAVATLMGSPAALAPTVVAIESAAQATAPAATGRVETLAAPAAPVAPQYAAPATPTPSTLARQDKSTQAPTSAPQALSAAPAAATPAPAAKAAESTTPVEPPVEQPITNSGTGGGGADNGLGGGGQAPGPLPAAPISPPQPGGPVADVFPAPTLPAAAPTEVARAAAPHPPPAEPRGGASQPQAPALDPLRIAEGALAALAVALGVAAWIARRRGR